MADQISIARWLVEHRQTMGLKIREFKWPRTYGMGLFDFEVELNFDGILARGRGTDEFEELALEKAAAEAFERWACSKHRIPTAGVACHSIESFAEAGAISEALERFTFNWHRREQIPFTPLDVDLSSPIGSARFYEMVSSKEHKDVLCIIEFEQRKFLGLGYENSISAAVNKSFIESFRNVASFAENPDLFLESIAGSSDFWCCDTEFITSWQTLLQSNQPSSIATMPTVSVHIENVSSTANFPFYIKRAQVTEVMR